MSSRSVTASEKATDLIETKLEEDGPIAHDELVDSLDLDEDEVQKAVNLLWRQGRVYHTVDRKFAVQDNATSSI